MELKTIQVVNNNVVNAVNQSGKKVDPEEVEQALKDPNKPKPDGGSDS